MRQHLAVKICSFLSFWWTIFITPQQLQVLLLLAMDAWILWPIGNVNFTCNISIDTYRLTINLSGKVFGPSLLAAQWPTYLQWKTESGDMTTLYLSHQWLTISRETNNNHSIVNELDDMSEYYDNQLSAVYFSTRAIYSHLSVAPHWPHYATPVWERSGANNKA